MVTTEDTASKLASGLLNSSKQWIVNLMKQQQIQVRQNWYQRGSSDVANTISDTSGPQERQKPEVGSTEYLVHNWLEAIFAWFQVVVLWHDPRVSLYALSGLLSSFLLLTYFAPRFYATIMIAIFISNLNKFWFQYVWPEIRVPPGSDREEEMRLDVDRYTYLHPQLMTLDELGHHVRNLITLSEKYIKNLSRMRQERPLAFCLLICSVFSCTAYIGNQVSGLCLISGTLTMLAFAPAVYLHLLPETARNWIVENIFHRIVSAPQESTLTTASSQELPTHSSQPKPACKTIGMQAFSLFESILKRKIDKQESLIIVPNQSDELLSNTSAEHSNVGVRSRDNNCDESLSEDSQRDSESQLTRRRRTSDDLSSHGSASLVDPDEHDDEQHDDFVLL